MSIEQLNKLPPAEFTAYLGPLFEQARIAEALFVRRPFSSFEQLFATAEDMLLMLPEAQQIAIVNSHPRIGERANLSVHSQREQGTDDHPAVLAELAELNRIGLLEALGVELCRVAIAKLSGEVDEHFGFPFVARVEEANQYFRARLHKLLEQP